jgi:hypothetical protein
MYGFADVISLMGTTIPCRFISGRVFASAALRPVPSSTFLNGFDWSSAKRKTPFVPSNATAFSYHRKNGYAALPRASIERIDFGRVAVPPKRTPGYLRAALGTPSALITLRRPLEAHGPYGTTCTVSRVGLVVDDLASFQRAIEH